MQKVTDYKVIRKGTAQRLTAEVKQHMEEGWVPSGTVVVFHDVLLQAMVKFEAA